MTDRASVEDRLTRRVPRWFFAAPEWIFRLRLGFAVPWWVMLVTTGRRSGRPRRVVLDVIRRDADHIWVLAADGRRADWVRNILADPRVMVWHGGRRQQATARPLDPVAAIDFSLEVYRRRPRYVRAVYRVLGEPIESEEDVRRLAAGTLPVELVLDRQSLRRDPAPRVSR
jgi:deazaflavin-dependent oxidoreductase (nitroreductase family)